MRDWVAVAPMFSPPFSWGGAPELPSDLFRCRRSAMGSYKPVARSAFRPGGTDIDSRLAKDLHSVSRLSGITATATPAATTAEPAATGGSWRDGQSLNRQVLAGSPLWPKQTELFGSSRGAISSGHDPRARAPAARPTDELTLFAQRTGLIIPGQAHVAILRGDVHEPEIDQLAVRQQHSAAASVMRQRQSAVAPVMLKASCTGQSVSSNSWNKQKTNTANKASGVQSNPKYRPYSAFSTRSGAPKLMAKQAKQASVNQQSSTQSAWGASGRELRYPYQKSSMSRHLDNQLPAEAYQTQKPAADPSALGAAIAQFQTDLSSQPPVPIAQKTKHPPAKKTPKIELQPRAQSALRGNRYCRSEMSQHFDTGYFAKFESLSRAV